MKDSHSIPHPKSPQKYKAFGAPYQHIKDDDKTCKMQNKLYLTVYHRLTLTPTVDKKLPNARDNLPQISVS